MADYLVANSKQASNNIADFNSGSPFYLRVDSKTQEIDWGVVKANGNNLRRICFAGGINVDAKKRNLKKLKELSAMPDDWNGYGAEAFLEEHISKCREIIDSLFFQPELFPTAAGSIQMEYEKKTGEYLEFNVFLDHIEVFNIDINKKESEFQVAFSEMETIQQLVRAFYG